MTDRWDTEAARLAPCSCWEQNGHHSADCHVGMQQDIATALRAAFELGHDAGKAEERERACEYVDLAAAETERLVAGDDGIVPQIFGKFAESLRALSTAIRGT